MFLNGIGTANPPHRYTKTQCWDAFKHSEWFRKLDRHAHLIAETVLTKDNGIESRTLALDDLSAVFEINPDVLHQRFLAYAPALSCAAAHAALEDAGMLPVEIDAVVISTCTGYLCPGLTSYVIERIGLRSDVLAFDLVGQGCAAALPNWKLSQALLSNANHVLSVCVEVSSAAMYLDNDPGVLISACLFGDGAGAAVLSRHPNTGRRSLEWKAFDSLTNTSERDALKFETRNGMLRNVLTRPVPRLAAEHAHKVFERVMQAADLAKADIAAWIMHAGGRDVLAALQDTMELDQDDLRYSSAMLRRFGNMSSAFVYFVLQAALRDNAASGWWWMSSFGAGFSCHGALLRRA
jgi:polyketide synthase Type III